MFKIIQNYPQQKVFSAAIEIETSKKLGWEVGSITERGFIAYTKNGLFLWSLLLVL